MKSETRYLLKKTQKHAFYNLAGGKDIFKNDKKPQYP
jgi:hypothetical protein